ncbi:hypothetical protein A2U01_0051158, partial [Trifolium medium]|nr:hypothetical protein [Trifolium medium]
MAKAPNFQSLNPSPSFKPPNFEHHLVERNLIHLGECTRGLGAEFSWRKAMEWCGKWCVGLINKGHFSPSSPSEKSLAQRASFIDFPKVSGWSEEASGMILAQRRL